METFREWLPSWAEDGKKIKAGSEVSFEALNWHYSLGSGRWWVLVLAVINFRALYTVCWLVG
jgi:hypothetical protein